MITVRKSNERGVGEHGWLHSKHTFSFAGYFDPQHVGYRTLRVINEDKVEGGRGFGRHGHQNMEIISYVVDGKLTHEDSTGNKETIGRGAVQFMSAGSGIHHSEFNGSPNDQVHFLQIWILPEKEDTKPGYADKDYNAALDQGDWVTLVSPDGRDDSIKIGQDAVLLGARPKKGSELTHKLGEGRGAWIQVIDGSVEVEGQTLEPGDGAIIEDVAEVSLTAASDAELLLFDLK